MKQKEKFNNLKAAIYFLNLFSISLIGSHRCKRNYMRRWRILWSWARGRRSQVTFSKLCKWLMDMGTTTSTTGKQPQRKHEATVLSSVPEVIEAFWTVYSEVFSIKYMWEFLWRVCWLSAELRHLSIHK